MQPIRPQRSFSSPSIELTAMQPGRPTMSTTAVAGSSSSSSSSPSYYTAVGSSALSQPPHWWQLLWRRRNPGSGRRRLLGSEENGHRGSTWRSGFWALLGGLVVALFILVIPTTTSLLLDFSDLMWHRRPKLLVRQRRVGHHRTFRILQLTDLHLGEAPYTEWGPAQDVQTFRLLRDLLAYENNNRSDDDGDEQDTVIDLVVFSGDQLTGNDVDGRNATVYYDQLGRLMDEMQLPYAMIFGNHDDMDYIGNNNADDADGTLVQHRARTLRRALATSDRRHRHSLTPIGPAHVFGVSNGVLDVHYPTDGGDGGDSQQQQQPVLQVVLLDSGGGSLPEQIVADQLDWYRSRRQLDVPAIAFQHIPTEQFRHNNDTAATGDDDHHAAICSGLDGENGIAPLDDDPTGEIARLAEIDANLLVLAVGHNHGNSYCCEQQQQHQEEEEAPTTAASTTVLCFGRHSGYGGYGRWDRGARIFTFHWETEELPARMSSWHTYVRLQDGNITDAYEPYM